MFQHSFPTVLSTRVSIQGITSVASKITDEPQRAPVHRRWHMLVEPILKRTIGIAVLMAGCTCFAQQTPIPFGQIQRDAQLSAMRMTPNSDLASVSLPEPASGSSSSALPVFLAPPASASSSAGFKRVPAGRSLRIFDARYFWLNGLHLTLAVSDIEMTQHCIDAHTCREANPLMPSSQAGKIGVNLGLVTYTAASSYWLRKRKSKTWFLGATVGITAHTVGLASGLMHR